MSRLFISHSSKNDDWAIALQRLADPRRLERRGRHLPRSRPRARHRRRSALGAGAGRGGHTLRGGSVPRLGGLACLEMVRRRIPARQQAQQETVRAADRRHRARSPARRAHRAMAGGASQGRAGRAVPDRPSAHAAAVARPHRRSRPQEPQARAREGRHRRRDLRAAAGPERPVRLARALSWARGARAGGRRRVFRAQRRHRARHRCAARARGAQAAAPARHSRRLGRRQVVVPARRALAAACSATTANGCRCGRSAPAAAARSKAAKGCCRRSKTCTAVSRCGQAAPSCASAWRRPNPSSTLLRELRQAAARRALISEPPYPLPVLCLDQGEELFAADAGAESERLLRLARAAIDADEALLLVTIRSDAYGLMQNARDAGRHRSGAAQPRPGAARRDRPHHPRAERDFAPQGRARRRRSSMRPWWSACRAEIAGETDALPLLAFVLQRLMREHADASTIGLEELEQTGGVAAAIEQEAEAALADAGFGPDRADGARCCGGCSFRGLRASTARARRRSGAVARQSELPAELADARPRAHPAPAAGREACRPGRGRHGE